MKFYLKLFLFLLTTVPAFSITYEVGFNEESKDPVFIQLESETSYLCYIENNKFIVERKGIDQDKFTFLDHEFFYSSEVLALKQIKLNNVDHILVTSSNELGFYISILEVTDNEIQRIDWLNNDIVSNSEIKDIDITEIGYEHLLITYTNQEQINFLHKRREELKTYSYDFSVKEFDIAMAFIDDNLKVNGAFIDSYNSVYRIEVIDEGILISFIDQININEKFILTCGYTFDSGKFIVNLENDNTLYDFRISEVLEVEKKIIDLTLLGENFYFRDYETNLIGYYTFIDNLLTIDDTKIENVSAVFMISNLMVFNKFDKTSFIYDLENKSYIKEMHNTFKIYTNGNKLVMITTNETGEFIIHFLRDDSYVKSFHIDKKISIDKVDFDKLDINNQLIVLHEDDAITYQNNIISLKNQILEIYTK